MLDSFPTNAHKLWSEEDIPSYDRLARKGQKQARIDKINKVIH